MRISDHRVSAYITAYQDLEALNTCLQAIQKQTSPVHQIIVVDNSSPSLSITTSTPGTLIWRYPQNIGIAGGLHHAIQWAVGQGYDFLWMFDQDSEPQPDCLEQLLQAYVQLANQYLIGMVAPTPIDPRTQIIVRPERFIHDRFQGFAPPDMTQPYECDAPITSGALLNLATVEHVSPPDPSLFMDGIDLDHGIRLKRKGFHNWVVPTASMLHHFGSPIQLEILGQKKVFQTYSALRYFYICRNHTWIELKHSRGIYKITCILRRIKFIFSSTFWILLLDPEQKLSKIAACIKGTYYGLANNLGKTF
ncbi:MAG: glycosyltransferase [Leptolyngbyaceae cyanobacterium MO_188.B28]|nr:glycosyltransferase [Leptolyngbyaceae cyanobacterium MO_188.B28]